MNGSEIQPSVQVQIAYDDDGFSGWVIGSGGRDVPVWCQVIVDGEHRASVRADEFLPWLGQYNAGGCRIGVSYRLPACLRDGRIHRVDLLFTFEQDEAVVQCRLPAAAQTFGAPSFDPAGRFAVCRAQDIGLKVSEAPWAERFDNGPFVAFFDPPAARGWAVDRMGLEASGFLHTEYVTHPAYQTYLADVCVRRSTGAVYLPGKGVWQDSHYMSGGDLIRQDLDFLSSGRAGELPVIKETALLACLSLHANYFHWMMDVLAGVQAHRRHIGWLPPLLTTAHLASWQRESLEFLIGEAALPGGAIIGDLPADADLVFCRRLVVPSQLGGTALFPDASATGLFTAIGDRVGHDPGARRRILISRRDCANPRILNENAVAEALSPLGFERLELGRLSVEVQARLFKESEMVVGAHGAGLTNCGFCRPGTRVLEIRGGNYPNPCFHHLCGVGGLIYASHVEPVPERGDGAENAATFEVDVVRLEATVRRMLGAA